jgi:micrococcal nuclease
MNAKLFLPCVMAIVLLSAGCDARTEASTPVRYGSALPGTPDPTAPSPAGFETNTPGHACVSSAARREEALVTQVVDGDTIGVEVNGVPFRVRYIGIDAPEMPDEPGAKDSSSANRSLVEGKRIVMIRDLSEADKYGRLLRYVFADGVFVNLELVRQGFARAGYYPPDTACTAGLRAAEEEARREQLGIWGLLGSPTYATRTGTGCADGCVTPPAGCLIKGNINSEGEKIYHVPGGRYYDQTVIDPEKGERWFCSEAEAVAAGWRKSKV